jgi:adenosylhomocysteinase
MAASPASPSVPTIAESIEDSPAHAFFSHVTSEHGRTPLKVICVAHMVDTTLHFLPAVSQMADVRLVLAKPRSVQRHVLAALEQSYRVESLSRSLTEDHNQVVRLLESVVSPCDQFCLVDIGGYFANALGAIGNRFETALRGVVEGTENGLKRYEALNDIPVPVYSVARSPLKYPENHLVGAGIAFSIEAVLRERGEVLQGRRAAVIGYGRIGRGVAHALRGRNLDVTVCDRDSIALAEAFAHGFEIARSTERALANAGLVVCATGSHAMGGPQFARLRDGAYVASVTSADDELVLSELEPGYAALEVADRVVEYRRRNHAFFLLNGGNAINFLHGGVLGPAIHLVEGEKLACIDAVATTDGTPGLHELSNKQRTPIAEIWLQHFSPM